MTLHDMKLVSIICEALAREPVLALLERMGVHGYTLYRVEGKGAHGPRLDDIEEFGNIQIEVIVPPALSGEVLERLRADFFSRYYMVAYEADIRVLRGDKF